MARPKKKKETENPIPVEQASQKEETRVVLDEPRDGAPESLLDMTARFTGALGAMVRKLKAHRDEFLAIRVNPFRDLETVVKGFADGFDQIQRTNDALKEIRKGREAEEDRERAKNV